jgi:hypothetical protein
MAISYDPKILAVYAERAYRAADNIIIAMGIQWGVIVAAGGYVFGSLYMRSSSPGIALVGLAVGALIGVAFAQPRAAELRLQAQLALCQAQIERNTRS